MILETIKQCKDGTKEIQEFCLEILHEHQQELSKTFYFLNEQNNLSVLCDSIRALAIDSSFVKTFIEFPFWKEHLVSFFFNC